MTQRFPPCPGGNLFFLMTDMGGLLEICITLRYTFRVKKIIAETLVEWDEEKKPA